MRTFVRWRNKISTTRIAAGLLLFWSIPAGAQNRVIMATMGADDGISGFRIDGININRSVGAGSLAQGRMVSRGGLFGSQYVCVSPGSHSVAVDFWDCCASLWCGAYVFESTQTTPAILERTTLFSATNSGAPYYSNANFFGFRCHQYWANSYMSSRGAELLWAGADGPFATRTFLPTFVVPDAGIGCSCPGNASACNFTPCTTDANCGGSTPTCDTATGYCIPNANICQASAWYERDIDSLASCKITERPHWVQLEWDALIPVGTRVEISFTHSEQLSDLTNAAYPRIPPIVLTSSSGSPSPSGTGRRGVVNLDFVLSLASTNASIRQDQALPGLAFGMVRAELFTASSESPVVRTLDTRFVCVNNQ